MLQNLLQSIEHPFVIDTIKCNKHQKFVVSPTQSHHLQSSKLNNPRIKVYFTLIKTYCSPHFSFYVSFIA